MPEVAHGKFDFDMMEHYARPDVLQLVINEKPMSLVIEPRFIQVYPKETYGTTDVKLSAIGIIINKGFSQTF